MDVGAPAVVAAIHDAIGVWITTCRPRPERILAAIGATPDAGRVGSRAGAGIDAAVEAPDRAGRTRDRTPDGPAAAPRRTPPDEPMAVEDRPPDARGRARVTSGSRQRRPGRARRARHAPAARRAARGPRPDRHEGGLRRGRVRRVLGPRRRRGRRRLPGPGLPGRRLRRPDGRGPRGGAAARGCGLDALQQAFLETGGAQCGICTPGMLMAPGPTSTPAAARTRTRSARRSPATSAAAPATPRSSRRSRWLRGGTDERADGAPERRQLRPRSARPATGRCCPTAPVTSRVAYSPTAARLRSPDRRDHPRDRAVALVGRRSRPG